MDRLIFEKQKEDWIGIFNQKDEFIGVLKYMRVGAWMSWCLMGVDEYTYYSASCLDEVRAKIKELNKKT